MQYNKIMAIDYGERRIGVAFSDFLQITSNPYEIYQSINLEKDVLYLTNLAKNNSVNIIVVGMPYSLDGCENERTNATKIFGEELAKVSGLQIVYEGECLTSHEAEEILREKKIPPKERKKYLDMLSAAIILDSYLARKK